MPSPFRVVFISLLVLGAMSQASTTPVLTDAGGVSGTVAKNGVAAYLGIPFAQAPIGELRWRRSMVYQALVNPTK